MRPQHPVDGRNHVQDPEPWAPVELGLLFAIMMVGLIFLMICVAGAVEALGYR